MTARTTTGVCAALLALAGCDGMAVAGPKPPAVGAKAPDFDLATPGDKKVQLSKLTPAGPVVVIALRGYPGYQCPICTSQVGSFIGRAKAFADAGARVVLVYPGPAANLGERAREFVAGKDLPENFDLVLDPGYGFVNAYGIRWAGPGETAYPSTFVVGTDGKVAFAKVSKEHGGRSSPDEVLAALKK